MFCNNCATQLPEHSKFCLSCGESMSTYKNTSFKMNTEPNTKLVPAKCTGCGASLEVDIRESAAICPYCNNAYIVEQAINNYNVKMDGNINVSSATINVSGVNITNLLVRAKDFRLKNEFENALAYYEQVLDIDFTNQEAHDGVEKTKKAIDNYIYLTSSANKVFTSGTLQLQKNRLVMNLRKGAKYTTLIKSLNYPLG